MARNQVPMNASALDPNNSGSAINWPVR